MNGCEETVIEEMLVKNGHSVSMEVVGAQVGEYWKKRRNQALKKPSGRTLRKSFMRVSGWS